jgi:hypothetical protein
MLLCLFGLVTACRPEAPPPAGGATDTAFAQMQSRGKEAMGVDQYTSAHRFDDLPNGGRIELQRDSTDTAGVRTIREHLQHITSAFANGDFSLPGFVHAESVPGTAVMTASLTLITYTFRPLPGGGEVLLTSADSAAVSAIHAFLAFQRQDHHAGGMLHP